MATESKKLMTFKLHSNKSDLFEHGLNGPVAASPLAIHHDARIAHELMDPSRKTPETPLEKEQREVIRRQDAALRAALEALELYHAYGWPGRAGVRAKLKTEIAAAAPYLLED